MTLTPRSWPSRPGLATTMRNLPGMWASLASGFSVSFVPGAPPDVAPERNDYSALTHTAEPDRRGAMARPPAKHHSSYLLRLRLGCAIQRMRASVGLRVGMHRSRRSVIVADRRPLERGLARFLLEERGLFVVGEAATMADVLLQVQQLRPDLLVLHEKLALDHDPTVTAQIRRISPRTKIVLLAASADALPPELVLLAETVAMDGPGLTELGAAVAGPIPESDSSDRTPPAAPIGAGAVGADDASRHWADRLQGMAVAAVIALAFLFARTVVLNPSTGASDIADAHLTAAYDSLDELAAALPDESPETIAELATALVDERARAEQAGADLTDLDHRILEALRELWPDLSPQTQAILVAILGAVIPPDSSPTLAAPATTPAP